jgi:hypothetical protein
MSQFNFTPEEDALVVSALQCLAEVQSSMHGGVTNDVQALIAKVTAAPVVEEEKPAKAKKTKAEDEVV